MKAFTANLPLLLILAALLAIHCLIGGTRPVFSLPAFALLGLAGLLAARAVRPASSADSAKCLLSTGMLFSYLLLRAAVSPVPYLARADLFLMVACLVVYLLAARVLVTARQRLLVVGGLLVLALIHVGVGVAQAAQGVDFMLFGFVRPPSGSRASGLFISPNHFAGFLEIAGVLGLSIAWWSARKPGLKVFAGYVALCCYVGLLLSQSRGGVVCAAVSLLVWVGLTLRSGYLKNPYAIDRTIFLTIGILVILLGVGSWLAAQHGEMRDRLATSFARDVRTSNWDAALAQFRSAPVLGSGAGTHLYLGRLHRGPGLQVDPIHAHSDYLELLAEYGIIAAAGMLVFLAQHARSGLRAMGRLAHALRARGEDGGDELALVVGALAAFAGLAAHSVIDFNLHIPGNALVMAFLFGVLAEPGGAAESLPSSRFVAGVSGFGRGAIPVLGGILLLLSILAWPGESLSERARQFLRNEDYPDASATARRSLGFDPWNPFTFFYLGEAHRLQAEQEAEFADRQLHREQAEQAFQKGLRLFPQDENLLVRRAQVLDRLQRFDEAEISWRGALEADPRLHVLQDLYRRRGEQLGTPPSALPQEKVPVGK